MDPYLAEMRKSRQNQLTGGGETPVENLPLWGLLLCCWGLQLAVFEAVAVTDNERPMTAEAAVASVFGAGHDGLHVGV